MHWCQEFYSEQPYPTLMQLLPHTRDSYVTEHNREHTYSIEHSNVDAHICVHACAFVCMGFVAHRLKWDPFVNVCARAACFGKKDFSSTNKATRALSGVLMPPSWGGARAGRFLARQRFQSLASYESLASYAAT
jgi:hypothetical protein